MTTNNLEITMLSLALLVPSDHNSRKTFDEDGLMELAGSIEAQGILQPLIVKSADTAGSHEIVAGERRFRAANILLKDAEDKKKSGVKVSDDELARLSVVPCIIRDDLTADDSEEINLIENLSRKDLTVMDKALAVAAYKERRVNASDSSDSRNTALARRLGMQKTEFLRSLDIAALPDEIRPYFYKSKNADDPTALKQEHAIVLTDFLKLKGNNYPDEATLKELLVPVAEEVYTAGLSPDQLTTRLRKAMKGTPEERTIEEVYEVVEQSFADYLGRPVKVKTNLKGGGTFTVKFDSAEDLQSVQTAMFSGGASKVKETAGSSSAAVTPAAISPTGQEESPNQITPAKDEALTDAEPVTTTATTETPDEAVSSSSPVIVSSDEATETDADSTPDTKLDEFAGKDIDEVFSTLPSERTTTGESDQGIEPAPVEAQAQTSDGNSGKVLSEESPDIANEAPPVEASWHKCQFGSTCQGCQRSRSDDEGFLLCIRQNNRLLEDDDDERDKIVQAIKNGLTEIVETAVSEDEAFIFTKHQHEGVEYIVATEKAGESTIVSPSEVTDESIPLWDCEISASCRECTHSLFDKENQLLCIRQNGNPLSDGKARDKLIKAIDSGFTDFVDVAVMEDLDYIAVKHIYNNSDLRVTTQSLSDDLRELIEDTYTKALKPILLDEFEVYVYHEGKYEITVWGKCIKRALSKFKYPNHWDEYTENRKKYARFMGGSIESLSEINEAMISLFSSNDDTPPHDPDKGKKKDTRDDEVPDSTGEALSGTVETPATTSTSSTAQAIETPDEASIAVEAVASAEGITPSNEANSEDLSGSSAEEEAEEVGETLDSPDLAVVMSVEGEDNEEEPAVRVYAEALLDTYGNSDGEESFDSDYYARYEKEADEDEFVEDDEIEEKPRKSTSKEIWQVITKEVLDTIAHGTVHHMTDTNGEYRDGSTAKSIIMNLSCKGVHPTVWRPDKDGRIAVKYADTFMGGLVEDTIFFTPPKIEAPQEAPESVENKSQDAVENPAASALNTGRVLSDSVTQGAKDEAVGLAVHDSLVQDTVIDDTAGEAKDTVTVVTIDEATTNAVQVTFDEAITGEVQVVIEAPVASAQTTPDAANPDSVDEVQVLSAVPAMDAEPVVCNADLEPATFAPAPAKASLYDSPLSESKEAFERRMKAELDEHNAIVAARQQRQADEAAREAAIKAEESRKWAAQDAYTRQEIPFSTFLKIAEECKQMIASLRAGAAVPA